MVKFKVGDRVRVLRHRNFHGGAIGPGYGLKRGEIIELVGLEDNLTSEKFEMFHVGDLGDGYKWIIRSDDIEHLPNSPIRTITRREIVPGVYGYLKWSASRDREVTLSINDKPYTAVDLREAARIFNEIADVLDEQKEAA